MKDRLTMNKDTIDFINHGASAFLNIAQMTQYRIQYVQRREAEVKEKMYKHAFLARVGILSLFTMGVLGLIESYKDDNVYQD